MSGFFTLATGAVHVQASTESTDAESEAILAEVMPQLELGLQAVADSIREKFPQLAVWVEP